MQIVHLSITPRIIRSGAGHWLEYVRSGGFWGMCIRVQYNDNVYDVYGDVSTCHWVLHGPVSLQYPIFRTPIYGIAL